MQKAHLHLIKWAVARGYSVAVYGEGEFDGIHSTYKTIKENVEACDMGQMTLLSRGADKPVGFDEQGEINQKNWISVASFAYLFDHGQEPDETIMDYDINLTVEGGLIIDVAKAWASDYDLHCSEVTA